MKNTQDFSDKGRIDLYVYPFCRFIKIYTWEDSGMEISKDSKKLAVDSPVLLKGIVKAIYKDTVHIQIGGKIIALPASNMPAASS